MRIFSSCVEMISETTRELFSRGERVFDPTRQGRPVSVEQVEIIGYAYRLTSFHDLDKMMEWAFRNFGKDHLRPEVGEKWFRELISPLPCNPDSWWQGTCMEEYWKKYGLREDGKFDYTYSERLYNKLPKVIEALKKNPFMRGAILAVYDRNLDVPGSGKRTPCTIAYHFIARRYAFETRLNLICFQRSCDLIMFFPLDVYKAVRLLFYVAEQVGMPAGHFIHFISSLHAYVDEVPNHLRW